MTKGREIENYLPANVVEGVAAEISGVIVPANEFNQVLDAEKVKKVDFARKAIEVETNDWPLDLRDQVEELVRRIRRAA